MRALFILFVAALLAACGGGPDASTLRADVEQRLNVALPENVLEITSFERKGSQADLSAPGKAKRRIVYYDAELKLNRDWNFGAWDTPGVAGLVSALGAGPRGIIGITSGGNQAGDVLRAHGTAVYQEQEGGSWAPVAPAGYRPPVAPNLQPEGGETNAILAALRDVVHAFPRSTSPAEHAAIQEELSAAQRAIRARLARVNEGYALAAGAEHGQYLRVARALFADSSPRIVPLITRGGEENLQLLRGGKVMLALGQADAAYDAYLGEGPFDRYPPFAELRAVASLYPEPLHVLVRGDGPISTIGALKGRRIAIGETGAASRTTALRVLEAHGLNIADFQPMELAMDAALRGLQDGTVDAVFQVIGVPAESIRDFGTSVPLRLLPLAPEAIQGLTQSHPAYFAHTIEAGAYPGETEPIQTVATAAMLLTSDTLSDSEVAALTARIFEPGRDYPALGSAQAAQITIETSEVGITVPMHQAASRTLAELGAGAPGSTNDTAANQDETETARP